MSIFQSAPIPVKERRGVLKFCGGEYSAVPIHVSRFLARVAQSAQRAHKRYRVPASALIVRAAFMSDWGRSQPRFESNLFWHRYDAGTIRLSTNVDVAFEMEAWRIANNPLFSDLVERSANTRDFLRRVQQYTNTDYVGYAEGLIAWIDKYDLDQFDHPNVPM